jgi:hypothetical protein
MKRTIVAATVAALAAGGIVADAAKRSPDPSTKCGKRGATTLTGSGDVRVYTVELKGGAGTSRTGVYACRFKTGKHFRLAIAAIPYDDDSTAASRYIRSIKISDDYGDGVGPGVAYVVSNCRTSCTARVIVRSLTRGKVVMNLKAGSSFDQIALSQPTDQGGFALAWLEASADGSCDAGCRVHLVKKSGDKVIAEGTDIDHEVFGLLDDESFGIIASSGSNSFVYKVGETLKLASFND